MFDHVGAFSKQFTPVDGGYLYYPSRRSGGKFVSTEEFQTLVADWQKRTGPWKVAGLAMVAIVLWMVASEAIAPPEWTDNIVTAGLVAAISCWIFWAAYAPRRIVKDRPEVAPPRPKSEARRVARSALNWPLVLFALLASGAIFAGHVIFPENTLGWWSWTIGSGLMFSAYLWIALQKFRDGPA